MVSKGGMGAFSPSRKLNPPPPTHTLNPVKEKIAKTSHIWQNFGFLPPPPPPKLHFAPSMPPQKEFLLLLLHINYENFRKF